MLRISDAGDTWIPVGRTIQEPSHTNAVFYFIHCQWHRKGVNPSWFWIDPLVMGIETPPCSIEHTCLVFRAFQCTLVLICDATFIDP